MTNETPPTPPTAEQTLSIIISNLFDIPENAQITVPIESIQNRIRLLQSGFVPEGVRKNLSAQIGMLNDVKLAFDAQDAKTSHELIEAIRIRAIQLCHVKDGWAINKPEDTTT